MANTYLSRSVSSASNRKTWTWSAWVKRSNITSYKILFSSYSDNNNYTRILFWDTQQLTVSSKVAGSFPIDYRLTRRFRDTSAWYHIVVAMDTTQATDTNRLKVYVNGVLETAYEGSSSSYPSQNEDTFINNNNTHYIGQQGDNSDYFDGSMSHINFIDGTAYDASYFGSTDANGVWKINTSPSVTYGTNGFFILKDGNSVTDQSGNSNNFTVGGGTLTKTEDNPSCVFATLNSLDNPYVGQIATFSNGNTTGQSTETGHLSGASTIGVSTGKYYVEIKPTNGNVTYSGIGVMTDPISGLGSTPIHDSGKLYGIRGNGTKITGSSTTSSWSGSYTTNDILGLALDLDNNRLYISKNGQYADGSGNFDEAFTGNPAYVTLASNQTYFFVGGSLSTGSGHYLTIQANFGNGYFGTTAVSSAGTNASGNGIFEFDCPTGYTALSTKGLNL